MDSGVETSLYADHVKIYPQRIAGRFRAIKWGVLSVLLGIYYVVPWLRWSRGAGVPDQAVLIDMPGRRAYFLWIEIWPQEVYYLAGLLILGACGLFFATALLGRVWCGYTCPQTVWTDLFLQVERWIEGDRNKRIKLDREKWSIRKLSLKLAKHAVWLVIALLTGGAWIMYFNDAPRLVRDVFIGHASMAQYGFIALFTGTTYLLAGWAREQVCIYMCPWPRFQSAMFDEHSLLVTYEAWRGEPRSHKKQGQAAGNAGDCIDCSLCVRVCPTGVDIREGQQLACIGCGLCIDACNSIMRKIGRPEDLITYDSLHNQAQRAASRPAVKRFIRPRTIFYAVIMIAVAVAMVTVLSLRSRLDVSLQADRAPLFVKLSDGEIQNGYSLKVVNKQHAEVAFDLHVVGLPQAVIKVIGQADARLHVAQDTVGSFRLLIHAPRANIHEKSTPITVFIINSQTGESASHAAIFSGPDSE